MSEEIDFLKQMQSLGVKPLEKGRELVKQKKIHKIQHNKPEHQPSLKYSSPMHRPKNRRPKKISRAFEPDQILDLHGLSLDQSIEVLARDLVRAYKKGCASMLVITGKGLNSPVRGGVLPKAIWQWLDEESPQFIISIELAPIFLGGSGAILLFFEC